MTKAQIREFAKAAYIGCADIDQPDPASHIHQQYQQVMAAIESLEDDRIYGLVALES